jgi:hypothetical protein
MVILKMRTKPVNFAYMGNSNCVEEKSFKIGILHGWNDFNTSSRSRFSVWLDKLQGS